MHEKIVVLQGSDFETFFWAPDFEDPESDRFRPVEQITRLSPSDMLLASLGTATAKEINTFARDHGIDLKHVELRLQYNENGRRGGRIDEEIVLYGNLSPTEHSTILSIANQCSIHRMLDQGMDVIPHLAGSL